jgi:plasmid stabilization system protein ParE
MTFAVVFQRVAQTEFDRAALWYEEQRLGLGTEFVVEIDRAIRSAAEHPERYPVMHRDLRCVRVRRFPYSVFYRIERPRVVVLALIHARRDPAVWQQRA